MKKNYLMILLFFIGVLTSGTAQCSMDAEFNKSNPKRDLRGIFLASVYSLNWPTNRLATPAVQQAELIAILDNLKANGYNTVFLQVRSECDALYNSSIEPWGYYLTGTQGLAPNPLWDPLSFAISEAHKRGLDLHAWLNPYRAKTASAYTNSANHITVTQPTWWFTSSADSQKILNPGLPAVKNYVISIVQDIATRYDVDGIHFDDYFYPNGGMATNQDAQTYIDNNPNNIATIADWRRDNVNQMIAGTYDAIQIINANLNKNIVFGVSPAGIWKSGIPAGISGNSAYSALYCDAIAWLNSGKVDYLAPQLYWKITGSQDYVALSKWWNDQAKASGKQLYISQAYYKMTDSNNWAASEIQNQFIQNRAISMDATFGQIGYNYTSIKSNSKTINDVLNNNQYKYKSFAPPIAGKDAICPNVPENIRFVNSTLTWDTPAAASDGDLPVKYVVYAFNNSAEAITNKDDGSKIIDIVVGNELVVSQALKDTKYFVVTSLDKNNNEGGNFSSTLGNPDFDLMINKSYVVYPNPFNDYFEIEFQTAFSDYVKVSIFDANGKQVLEQDYVSTNSKISVTPINIDSGIYFVKISFENGASESFKIIKQ
ncbi:family 10 glycosylhydrolase [Flavobacterium sp. LS1R47]|uniref:Family 10 glycosylhydrolase n=1 Tax=Flavobacterium frigoritolerans TaxID=2987686 RepID=A0A9X2YYA0_9FLAO|nr:family 10 glycosylhydrolase [Flavobacterium frigoritolerans]MCV9931398.1 family 10 glycosylhydrolase [Flavobacterium frigoritolerans]